MPAGLNIAFFGSSLLSAYWNGAATYYRGIIRALHERGHRIRFYESDAYDRQKHRDIDPPDWAEVVVYSHHGHADVRSCLHDARHADLIVKASGNGAFDELLEAEVLELQTSRRRVCFWDVDAPATLDRIGNHPRDAFRPLVPRYDLIFTYGGGQRVVDAYESFGARRCVPIYNAVDPRTHHPAPSDPRFEGDLAFLGNRLPDREARVEEFFFRAARAMPDKRFVIGGSGWADKSKPANVVDVGHVYTASHNAFNCTPRAVLNINRQSMATFGFSPATRVFEAAGAGACLITDAFEGVEAFFEPDREILVAADGDAVAEHVASLTRARAQAIGDAAYRAAMARHTYAHRALDFEAALGLSSTATLRVETKPLALTGMMP
jgi:spore maturation protein CgeB